VREHHVVTQASGLSASVQPSGLHQRAGFIGQNRQARGLSRLAQAGSLRYYVVAVSCSLWVIGVNAELRKRARGQLARLHPGPLPENPLAVVDTMSGVLAWAGGDSPSPVPERFSPKSDDSRKVRKGREGSENFQPRHHSPNGDPLPTSQTVFLSPVPLRPLRPLRETVSASFRRGRAGVRASQLSAG